MGGEEKREEQRGMSQGGKGCVMAVGGDRRPWHGLSHHLFADD